MNIKKPQTRSNQLPIHSNINLSVIKFITGHEIYFVFELSEKNRFLVGHMSCLYIIYGVSFSSVNSSRLRRHNLKNKGSNLCTRAMTQLRVISLIINFSEILQYKYK